MRETEKQMKDVLSRDVQVSDLVNQRLWDTYKILERKQGSSGKKRHYGKNLRVAAAVAAIVCLAAPSMVYASVKFGFFEAMFGNTTKKSSDVIHTEVDTGKGSTTPVDIPSKEFVPVDEGTAEEMIGQWVMEEPVTRKIGEHTLTIENFTYDRIGALMYFTLGRDGGVTALRGDERTNLTKGASLTDDSDFILQVQCGEAEDDNFVFAGENIYVDLEKSTDDLLYCSSYLLWSDLLDEGDIPKLVITKYPDTLGNIKRLLPDTTNMTEEEMQNPKLYQKYEEAMAKAETETIELSDKGQVPVKTVDLGENGYLEYSPIAISVDLSKGMGLTDEEAYDPGNLDSLVIRYKDGSEYVVSDREKLIENSGYQLGGVGGSVNGDIGTYYSTIFNRLVETGEIAEILVNGVSFPVE